MRTVKGWVKARRVLEEWRRNLTDLQVVLRSPRAIDITPVDFVAGEPVAAKDIPRKKFKAKLIFFTRDDATVRRPSGALLVIDTYELESLADRKTRVEP